MKKAVAVPAKIAAPVKIAADKMPVKAADPAKKIESNVVHHA